MRVNTTSDVVGVEICGALKNVLAIAAGIVEGLELGNNAMAALIAQGCSEIRRVGVPEGRGHKARPLCPRKAAVPFLGIILLLGWVLCLLRV
jgi:glycerol-3-phosphate dehydrogenase